MKTIKRCTYCNKH